MRLVDLHFALLAKVIEPLLRMDVALGRDPTGSVKRRGQRAALNVLPLHAERDRVLGIDTLLLGNAARCQRGDRNRPGNVSHAPHVEVDVMRVEVIADVARFAGPGAERFQLVLGLAHVR
jgi:hypothetical protein